MSYAIIRNTNYKRENLAGIYRHNERKNTNYSNKEISKEKSIKNYSLKQPHTTYAKAFDLLKEQYELKGRIIKTTNVACEFIITSDKEFFERIGEEETKRYFQTAYQFVAGYQNLGEQYILSAKVHMDETTPHLHIVFVPVVHTRDKDGKPINKIACSEYWKGKDSYVKLQNNFYNYMTKAGFDLQRGNSKENKHIPIEILKKIMQYDNIKYEMTQEEIKPLETQNKALIVAQNEELIDYNKKLKLQLSKSYHAINSVQKLQQENMNLSHENEELKKENHKLRKYIDKALEAVNLVFNFPIKIFKDIVDNLINELEK